MAVQAERIRLFFSGIQYCEPLKIVLKLLPGELAGVVGERAVDHLVQRQPQEDQNVDGERRHAEPGAVDRE